MIRVIGLRKELYERILNQYEVIVRDYDEESCMIEFIPQCTLKFHKLMLTIEYSDNCVNFLNCDFWRIEIE